MIEAEMQINMNSSEILNLFMVSKFPELKHMYLNAIEETANEKALELYQGWQEYHNLDDESKKFVRDYMIS